MSETTHSPLPWRIAGKGTIRAGDGWIGTVHWKDRDANAALIVRAVNCHAELAGALRDIADMIGGCPDVPRNPDSLPQMILARARAALAKAGA